MNQLPDQLAAVNMHFLAIRLGDSSSCTVIPSMAGFNNRKEDNFGRVTCDLNRRSQMEHVAENLLHWRPLWTGDITEYMR